MKEVINTIAREVKGAIIGAVLMITLAFAAFAVGFGPAIIAGKVTGNGFVFIVVLLATLIVFFGEYVRVVAY